MGSSLEVWPLLLPGQVLTIGPAPQESSGIRPEHKPHSALQLSAMNLELCQHYETKGLDSALKELTFH